MFSSALQLAFGVLLAIPRTPPRGQRTLTSRASEQAEVPNAVPDRTPDTASFDGILPCPRRPSEGARLVFFGQGPRQLITAVKKAERASQTFSHATNGVVYDAKPR